MKILNLYSGIGGNRCLWDTTGEHEITAVEINPDIAKIYSDFFPKDKMVIADAHQYLLERFSEFDFIWSSPPCQTHSRCNYFLHAQGKIRYPDMALWQEIIFLQKFCKTKYCVENTKAYYHPFILPREIGRHWLWTNFMISDFPQPRKIIGRMHGKSKGQAHDISQIEHNKTNANLGLHVLKEAMRKDSLFAQETRIF